MHAGAGPATLHMSTQDRGACRWLYRGLVRLHQRGWEDARIQLGNINRGQRDPRINPELEADTRGTASGECSCCGLGLVGDQVGCLGRGWAGSGSV